jgi:hypothetical protein
MRRQAKHGVSRGRDQRNSHRRCVDSSDCSFKVLVGDPARLEPDEGGGKVVSPASKWLVRALRLG